MKVEQVFGSEGFVTVSTAVGKEAGEMDGLHVFPKIATVRPDLATNCAFLTSWTHFRGLHNVLIKLLVVLACKVEASFTVCDASQCEGSENF
jgi:hypothetical protein